MEVKIHGIEDVISKMDFSIRKINDQANEALRLGGEVMKKSIENNTPLGPGNHGEHAVDNVALGRISTDGAIGGKSIKVGYNTEVAWRMWFLEKGTYSKGNPKGIKPRNIVEKSFLLGAGASLDSIKAALQEAVGG